MTKTSDTHPLIINYVQVPYVNGTIGMTFCPGKKGQGFYSGAWNRDLGKDLSAIIDWSADALVSLVEDHEFDLLKVSDFKDQAQRSPFQWFHLPIVDVSVPCEKFEREWAHAGNEIRGILARGGKVVFHCRGGLGRTGLLAARLLVEFGLEPEEAIAQVRGARPGAIETKEQEQYIYECKSRNSRRTLDHYLGCLIGGAIGDSLGAAVEFDSLTEIRKKYGSDGIQKYAEAFGRVGAITDDTQMTLFSSEGLLRASTRASHKGIGPSFASCTYYAYRRWLVTQDELSDREVSMDGWLVKERGLYSRRAPGNTCLAALKDEERHTIGQNRPHNTSKGCGAVMRTAPSGLIFQSPYVCGILDSQARDEYAFENGRDLGYLTHGHPDGYWPAAFLAMLIGRIIDGDDVNKALDKTCAALEAQKSAGETLMAINNARRFASDSTFTPCPETIEKIGEGWVGEEALAIAIYCVLVAKDNFDYGIRLAVNHGGDSDSTGAITGNILGALLGRKAIDEKWLEQLELREVIEQFATDLFVGFQNDDEWWDKYPGH